MFWGCKLKENKSFEIRTGINRIIHLSEACLTSSAGEGKVYVKLICGDEKYSLCVLQKDKWESYKLDHFLSLFSDSTTPYKLCIQGGDSKTEVHITGYIETEEGEEGLTVERDEQPLKKVEKKEVVKKVEEKQIPAERKNSKEQPAPKQAAEPKKEQSAPKQAAEPKKEQPAPKQAVEPKKEQPAPKQAVELKKEHPAPKQVVELKKEQPKPAPQKPVEDLNEDSADDDDLSQDDLLGLEDASDDEEEMEKLLNKTKKEEAKPVKLQKLDDGSKKATQTALPTHKNKGGKPFQNNNQGKKQYNGGKPQFTQKKPEHSGQNKN